MTTQQLFANLIELLALGRVNTDEEKLLFAQGFGVLLTTVCDDAGLPEDDAEDIATVERTLLQKLHKNAHARRQYLNSQAA